MKKDHGNEFRGSKNEGREVWVVLEWPENGEIRRPKVAVAPAFVGLIWASPAAVRREISRPRSTGGGAPTWVERASRKCPETSPTVKTQLALKRFETTQFGSIGLGEFFLAF